MISPRATILMATPCRRIPRLFPFALGARDVALVRRQMRGDDVGTYAKS
jgi:hypothetical protein